MNNKGNFAFIDGNNLYLGLKSQKISIDYAKFRLYLKNKYQVQEAFIFIGYYPGNAELYTSLQKAGFILIHKPTIIHVEDGKSVMKGNVDAELVLNAAAIEYKNFNKAVIISGDGDFACLLHFLVKRKKLGKIITPSRKYSTLLNPFSDYIVSLPTIVEAIKK